MKLRNKKTGKIIEFKTPACMVDEKYSYQYDSLAELNEEWEDYKEPKDDGFEHIITLVESYSNLDDEWYPKEIVEKLKAWRRLEDKGFRITLHGCKGNAWLQANWGNLQGDYSDVLLLFGGEDE